MSPTVSSSLPSPILLPQHVSTSVQTQSPTVLPTASVRQEETSPRTTDNDCFTSSGHTTESEPLCVDSQLSSNFNVSQLQEVSTSRPMTRAQNNIFKPNKFYGFTAVPSSMYTPVSFKQAQKYSHWRDAMQAEYTALLQNKTWVLVPPTASQNVVDCQWIFKIKQNSDGSVERYKARLVAKGFTQRSGIDFHDTFSPVIKPTTIRLVLSIAVKSCWNIHQLDINNAFLQGHLDEEVYMRQPPRFVSSKYLHYVCKLRKPIYGLKQASRSWDCALKSYLITIGFSKFESDASLFILSRDGSIAYVLVYVDDIIVTGCTDSVVEKIIQQLSSRFSLKDLDPLHYFLGVEVFRYSGGLILSQSKYIQDLLVEHNMHESNDMPTPMSSSLSLTTDPNASATHITAYRRIIGKLQYLSFTRPDIAFAVNKLAQYMHHPQHSQWLAIKRLLRYLKLTFARSSTEAEYRAVASAVAETNWLSNLLFELKCPLQSAPDVFCDNVGTTYLCRNPVFHSRMKHIALDFHIVREQVSAKQLSGKVIVMYFVSLEDGFYTWMEETKHLMEIYHTWESEGGFEVVFVAVGDDIPSVFVKSVIYKFTPREASEDIFSKMACTAIPFPDLKSRNRLEKIFGVSSGVDLLPPSFVIDPKGLVLQSNATYLFSRYGAAGYPFTDGSIQCLDSEDNVARMQLSVKTVLGSLLASPECNSPNDESYFTGTIHWTCTLKKLKEWYIKMKGKLIKSIFDGSDQGLLAFDDGRVVRRSKSAEVGKDMVEDGDMENEVLKEVNIYL
ncbi:hypothetical protein AgCh_001427 [Apium graveolens]